MPELVLHTHNLSINNGDVERPMYDFQDAMLVRRPDVIMTQEVSIDIGQTALRQLAVDLGPDYTLHYEAVYPGQEDEQGVAIITSLPVSSISYQTRFKQGGNEFQIMPVQAKDRPLLLTNVHVEAAPQKEALRLRKWAETDQHLEYSYPAVPRIIAGDTNTLPFMPGILQLKHLYKYVSAYEQVHGHEPEFTFPCFDADELVAGKYLKPAELAMLQRIAKIVYAKRRLQGDQAPEIPRYTTDYVLTKDMPAASTAEVLVRTRPGRPAIADHAGITVSWPM